MGFLQSKHIAVRCKPVVTKQNMVEYALAIIGSIIAVYICSTTSKDAAHYLEIYIHIFDHVEIEYLFRSWLGLGAVLGVSFRTILLPLVFFTLILKLKSFKHFGVYSVYAFIAYIAIFYLLHDCSQLRISAALAFALWSCIAIMHRKWVYALLLCFIAIGFHITSLLLPIVFTACFYSRKVRELSWYFLLLGWGVYFFKLPIMASTTHQAALLLGGRYLNYTDVFVQKQNTSGFAFVYATFLAILLIILYYWGKENSKILPKSYAALLSICVYGCGLLFWLYETVAVAFRLSDVLIILIVPLLAIVISNLNFVYRSLSIMVLCIFFSGRFIQLFIH